MIRNAGVKSLEDQFGITIGSENVDCGTDAIVLDPDKKEMICGLTQSASGNVFDATITFTDLATGAFDIVVADQPRG